MSLPPGPGGLPLVGNPYLLTENILSYVIGQIPRYGNLFTMDFGPNKIVYMIGPRYNHFILTEQADNFLNGPVGDLMGGPIYGDGVLFMDGPDHKQARRMMQPAFHRKRVASYLQVIVEEIQKGIATWSGELDIAAEMHHLTLNVVARLLFNLDMTTQPLSQVRAWDKVMSHNGDLLGVILARIPFSNRRQGLRVINRLIYTMIAERRANPQDSADVLSMLLEAQDEDQSVFTDAQIRDQLFILFLAGHETSANGLAFIFYLLAQHPEWARRVLEELDSVLGGRAPTLEEIDKLTALDMVVRESLRLMPPVPGFLRTVASKFEVDGYEIPAGTLLYYFIFATHRMSELYPQPEVWRPERFAPDAERKYTAYEYLPFGAGARTCIGMPMAVLELKTILILVMQKYRLDLMPDQDVSYVFRGSLYPRGGIRMRVNSQDGHVERSPARVTGNVPGAVAAEARR